MSEDYNLGRGILTLQTTGLGTIQADLNRLQGIAVAGITNMARLGAAVGVAFAAADAAVLGLVRAFEQARDVTIQLRNALAIESNGVSRGAKAYEDYADALGRVANLNRTVVQGLEIQALRLGVSEEQARQATRTAIGLAYARGVSEEQALEAVSLAIQGQEMALRRLIGLKRGGGGLTGNALLAEAGRMGETGLMLRAADEAETFGGKVRSLGIELSYAARGMGELFSPWILPLVQGVSEAVRVLSETLHGLTDEQKSNIERWALTAAGIGAVAVAIPALVAGIGAIGAAFSFLAATPVGLLITGLGLTAGAFIAATAEGKTMGEKTAHVFDAAGNIWRAFKSFVEDIFHGIASTARSTFGSLGEPIAQFTNSVLAMILNLDQKFAEFFKGLQEQGDALKNLGKPFILPGENKKDIEAKDLETKAGALKAELAIALAATDIWRRDLAILNDRINLYNESIEQLDKLALQHAGVGDKAGAKKYQNRANEFRALNDEAIEAAAQIENNPALMDLEKRKRAVAEAQAAASKARKEANAEMGAGKDKKPELGAPENLKVERFQGKGGQVDALTLLAKVSAAALGSGTPEQVMQNIAKDSNRVLRDIHAHHRKAVELLAKIAGGGDDKPDKPLRPAIAVAAP